MRSRPSSALVVPLLALTGGPRAAARGGRALAVGVVVTALALTGCSSDDAPDDAPEATTTTTAATTTPDPTPTPSATEPAAPAVDALSDEDLTALFTRIQFPPGRYAGTTEMVQSVYPGLTVSDPACLAPFGLGWETQAGDAAVVYGTSNDRSMTAVVVSAADPQVAQGLLTGADDALGTCADTASIAMGGTPVQVRLERTEPELTGTDETLGWTATGDLGGAPFTLVGITARVGGSVVALVGWDPATSADYVPQATQMFVDGL
ncbi:hypothetical protein [Cellulomonas sp. B6]|uniref:hypothetical protein n=1 Tax=Cellulomonas sp. B6 TaxID=1295626 RepID=UPI00073B929D|nr:hypothetical protein [Cellulomonas sp. B6]KSW19084.1 hypothetical protein ATM99_16700 [Cellulomonas sp. B6]